MTFQELVNKFVTNPRSMNKSSGQLAKRYNLTAEEVQRAKKDARFKIYLDSPKTVGDTIMLPPGESPTRTHDDFWDGRHTGYTTTAENVKDFIESTKVNNDTGTIQSDVETDFLPEDDIALAKLHKIDLTKYRIVQYWSKRKSNGKFVHSLLAALHPVEKVRENSLAEVLKNYKFSYKPITKDQILSNHKFQRKSLVLISIADFHLDKRTLDGKTLEEKIKLYENVVTNLLLRSYMSHKIEEICYLISNDFLHTDNYQEGTTKGTPQQSSTSWHNAYEAGFDLQVRVINHLKQFCNKLFVVHVPSNHSRTKEYYMAHGLSIYFKPDANIIFDRTAEPTKCITYGNTFLGFHHGDVKDYNQLPTYFASKYKKEWGQSTYVEIALADKHHRKEWKHSLTKNEVHGSRMFIAPSLSGPDIWHKDSLYDLAIAASIARIYDFEKGYVGEIEERI